MVIVKQVWIGEKEGFADLWALISQHLLSKLPANHLWKKKKKKKVLFWQGEHFVACGNCLLKSVTWSPNLCRNRKEKSLYITSVFCSKLSWLNGYLVEKLRVLFASLAFCPEGNIHEEKCLLYRKKYRKLFIVLTKLRHSVHHPVCLCCSGPGDSLCWC